MNPKREAYERRKSKHSCTCFEVDDGWTLPTHQIIYRLCTHCKAKIHINNLYFGGLVGEYWHTKYPANINNNWTYGLCPRNKKLEIHEPMDAFAQKAYERSQQWNTSQPTAKPQE